MWDKLFCLEYSKFERFVGYISGDIKQVDGYMGIRVYGRDQSQRYKFGVIKNK